MNRIANEQIKFFFQHESQIREWANLETEVNKFVDGFYRSLKGDLDAALKSGRITDAGVKSAFVEGKHWSRLVLKRQNWIEKADVRLEWQCNKSFPPYGGLDCGVWISDKKYSKPFTKEACRHYPNRYSVSYPAYKGVEPPSGRFWEDDNLKKYGEHLVETILKAWEDLAPLVDKAVGHQSS